MNPGFLALVIAALMTYMVGGPAMPATAYVAVVIGCLLGADLLNLGRIRNLGHLGLYRRRRNI